MCSETLFPAVTSMPGLNGDQPSPALVPVGSVPGPGTCCVLSPAHLGTFPGALGSGCAARGGQTRLRALSSTRSWASPAPVPGQSWGCVWALSSVTKAAGEGAEQAKHRRGVLLFAGPRQQGELNLRSAGAALGPQDFNRESFFSPSEALGRTCLQHWESLGLLCLLDLQVKHIRICLFPAEMCLLCSC